MDAETGAGTRFPPVGMQALDISFTIGQKKILRNVSANFPAGTLSALMGPSGAGKTTLLSVLCGRAAGRVQGRVLINGQEVQRAAYKDFVTLMPQDDILHGALTVEQCVYYAAYLRCPPEWSQQRKVAAADQVMDILGLAGVRKNRIGDEQKSGISGGQRKRVSACVEFLAARPILFMDEPTSGLDSATAKALMVHLASLSRQEGRTIIATIHQPAWTIMNLFEGVCLLAKGGRVCYRGAPAGIPKYFAAHGSPCPDTENPADHMLYVLSAEGGAERWASTWEREEATKQLAVVAATADDGLPAPSHPTFFQQYVTLTKRTMLIYAIDPAQGLTQFTVMFCTLFFLGVQVFDAAYTTSLANAIFFYGLLLYMSSTLQTVIVMPLERAVVTREFRNGTYPVLAYWLSRVSLSMVVAVFQALLATLVIYPMVQLPDHPANKIFKWYTASYMLLATLHLFGMFLGILLPSALIMIKAVPAVMTLWVFGSGTIPPHNRMRPALAWLWRPQPLSYAEKIFLITAFDNGQEQAEDVLRSSDLLDVNVGNEESCFWALFACFWAAFFLGLAATHFRLNHVAAAVGSRPQKPSEKGAAADLKPSEKDAGYGTSKDPLLPPAQGRATDDVVPITLDVRRLTFRPHGSSTKTLQEISATFPAGTVTALMGPSGAGKTTLVSVVLGRARGTKTGDILANGRPCETEAMRMFATLTPQDDIMLPDLTVRQTLYYMARLRIGDHVSYADKLAKAESIIAQLGLEEASDVIVGNVLRPGISGGQKKRLSIGCDLVSGKSVLVLDEPTTGLDANAALTVMQIICRLRSGTRRTLIATIHQPQFSVLSQFDQLCLIGGGRNIFTGDPNRVADFFAAGGRPRDANENPADHMIFALKEDGIDKWASQWVLQGAKYQPTAQAAMGAGGIEKASYAVSPVQQYFILLERCTYTFVMDEDQGVEYLMPPVFLGTLVGIMWYNFGYNLWLASGIFLGVMVLMLLSTVGMVLNMPLERPLTLREYRNGVYCRGAYWAARATLAVFAAAVVACIQIPIWWTLIDLPARNLRHAQLIGAMTSACYAIIGCIIGLLAPDPLTAAQLTEPVNGTVVLLSGVLIPQRRIKSYIYWLYKSLPMGYCIESMISLGFVNQGEKAEDILDSFDFYPKHTARNHWVICLMLGALIGLGFLVTKMRITVSD